MMSTTEPLINDLVRLRNEMNILIARFDPVVKTGSINKRNDIESLIFKRYGFSFSDLKPKNRSKKVVVPRQVAMYLLNKYTTYVLHDIGSLFNRDHTTVINACNRIKDYCDTEPDFKADVEELENELNSEL